MPSPFAHVTAGYLLYRLYGEKFSENSERLMGIPLQLLLLASVSLLPDLDAIPGILLGDMVRFHNNASHSLIGGLLAASVIASLITRKRKVSWSSWFVAVLLVYEFHVLLDLFAGERGLMLLWPFTPARFASPVKLFYGVQWGLGLFSIWHIWTIFTEILFFLTIFMFVKLFMVLKRVIVTSTSRK